MDRAKYRSLRADGKGWVYGYLFMTTHNTVTEMCLKPCIQQIHENNFWYDTFEVIPDTVGQYTGRPDKNGREIYEGDKFNPDTDSEEVMAVVRWDDEFSKYVVDSYGYNFHIGEGSQEVYDNEISICDSTDLGDISSEYLEVIGNIHEKGADT